MRLLCNGGVAIQSGRLLSKVRLEGGPGNKTRTIGQLAVGDQERENMIRR
jgi:hypothetical protein